MHRAVILALRLVQFDADPRADGIELAPTDVPHHALAASSLDGHAFAKTNHPAAERRMWRAFGQPAGGRPKIAFSMAAGARPQMTCGALAALCFGLLAVVLAVFAGVPSAAPDAKAGTTSVAAGYWGVPTAVHQFCEPKYASSQYLAEFYNSISSLLYVAVAAYALSHLELRRDPMMVLSAALVALIGLGSAAFHGTMRFEYELCDEVPMLLFIAVALCNKMGAHAWLIRPASCVAFATAVVAATATLSYAYIKSGEYEIFVAGFTMLVVVDTALALTWRSSQPVTNFARNLSVGCIVLGKTAWEVEVRGCATTGRVWPLHVCWHVFSAASLYYGLLADLAARIDCGLFAKRNSVETVPLRWAGVPYSEVRVVHARPEDRQSKVRVE